MHIEHQKQIDIYNQEIVLRQKEPLTIEKHTSMK